ncbi:MAG: hypothetical protein LBD67_03240 [Candidatus Accumulibacter sp.]|jgi:hypothetical protein|nr:hypothetical protein [Accumulibacter sp.]
MNFDKHLSPFVLSLSKYERTLQVVKPFQSSLFLQIVFQSLPFDRLRTGRAAGFQIFNLRPDLIIPE